MRLNVRKEEVSRLRVISFLVRVETILEGLVIQGDSFSLCKYDGKHGGVLMHLKKQTMQKLILAFVSNLIKSFPVSTDNQWLPRNRYSELQNL